MIGRLSALAGVALLGGVLAASTAAAGEGRLGLRDVVERAIAESHLVKAGG